MTSRATVLVVDDEPGLREMLSYELGHEGFDVEAVESGAAAVEAVKRRKFDLALTDLKMPGMDGAATVLALRRIDPDLEVIVATGYATVETAISCMKNGAYDYIQKPYDLADLTLLLDRAMKKSHLQGVLALYEASRALLGTLEQSRIIDIVLSLAGRVLRADDVCLLLKRDSDDGHALHRPPSERHLPDDPYLDLARLVEGTAVPLLAGGAGPALLPTLSDAGCASAVAYPLNGKASHLGALVLLRRAGSADFGHSELQRGCVFATQLALSLDNARVYQELEGRLRELVATRDELVRAEKLALAAQLAGAVAHELNTPLAVVHANLDALRDYSSGVGALWIAAKAAALWLRRLPNMDAIEHARRLESHAGAQSDAVVSEIAAVIDDTLEGVRRIAELVARFGTLARPTPSTSPPERFAVAALVEECVASLGQRANRRIKIEPAAVCEALACRGDVRTAILNVLDYLAVSVAPTSPSSAIDVSLRSVRGRAVLALSDRSRSLSTEDRARVFDPRLDVASDRTMRLDTGLVLAQRLLSANGAQLSLADPAEEEGLRFIITLPAPMNPS